MNKILIVIILFLSLCACANRTTQTKIERANLYYNKGLKYYLKEENKTAILYYDSAIMLRDDASYYMNRGVAKYQIGDTIEALQDYSKAINIDSANFTAIANIATVYHDKKDYKTALTYYQRSFQLSDRQAIYDSMGHCLYMLGNYKEALSYFKKHLERDPSLYPEGSYLYMGNCYEKLGDMDAACQYWEKAATLGEEEAKQKLNSIK